MVSHLPNQPYFSPAELAALLMVSPVTVRGWAARGLLRAETTPGGHRRFLRSEVEHFLRDRARADHVPTEHPLRVLVVDDDDLHRAFLVEALASLDGRVEAVAAEDGFEAGRKLAECLPDVVLLDLMMPGLDGFEVCRRIKVDTVSHAVRVIVMASCPGDEQLARAIGAGAERLLAKPIDMSLLLRCLGLTSARGGQ